MEKRAKLQEIELERTGLAQSIRALPAEIAQAELAVSLAQQAANDANGALEREEQLRVRMERDAEMHRKKAAHFRSQQDVVTTTAQAEAVEHELHFAEQEIERLENEEYASLERSEAQEVALAKARAQVEEQAEALEKIRERVEVRKQELTHTLEETTRGRELLRKQIDPDLLVRFDRIALHRGTGLARADDRQCRACSMGVRPQTWIQLREGQLLNCDSCGRLLYWDPTMVPAPMSPQAEKAGSDGRAIRRPQRAGA